jgi:hypothetical protein
MSALGPVDYALLIADLSVEVCALAALLKKRAFSQHFTLVLFLSASIAVGIGRYCILVTDGFTSNTYLYFYFFSDALLIICLYFVLMSLYIDVFSDMNVGKLVRAGAVMLLAGTALISYYMVAASTDKLVTHFVMEMSQNLYFVGVLLTYVLWGAMMKLRENRSRLMQLVLSMGVYFSAFAASFALGNLYPDMAVWRYVSHLMVTWLPISWAYTFMKVSEDARLDTVRVVAPTQ